MKTCSALCCYAFNENGPRLPSLFQASSSCSNLWVSDHRVAWRGAGAAWRGSYTGFEQKCSQLVQSTNQMRGPIFLGREKLSTTNVSSHQLLVDVKIDCNQAYRPTLNLARLITHPKLFGYICSKSYNIYGSLCFYFSLILQPSLVLLLIQTYVL